MKRILFVIESLFPLGPAQQLIQLVNDLVARSWDVQVAVLHHRNDPRWTSPLKCTVLPLGHMPVTHPFSRACGRSIVSLRRLLHEQQRAILHSWCGNAAAVTLAAAQFRISSEKTPRLLHTELAWQPEKPLTQQWLENRISRGFEITIIPHESARPSLVENWVQGRTEIIPNRVDAIDVSQPSEKAAARQWLRDKLKLAPDAKIAGTAAPLIARTRLKDLIWANDLLTVVRDDFHFLILGCGRQMSRLQQFSALTESQRTLHFLGQPATAARVIAGLDVYWHSHLSEPLPSNLLNAMARGIPAISVYGPGTQEVIRHQETGLAVNFGARDEFARWTKYIIEQPLAASKLARQGQQYVQQKFSGEAMTEKYLRLYE